MAALTKPVRSYVSADTLDRLDALAKARRVSRSALILAAVLIMLAGQGGPMLPAEGDMGRLP